MYLCHTDTPAHTFILLWEADQHIHLSIPLPKTDFSMPAQGFVSTYLQMERQSQKTAINFIFPENITNHEWILNGKGEWGMGSKHWSFDVGRSAECMHQNHSEVCPARSPGPLMTEDRCHQSPTLITNLQQYTFLQDFLLLFGFCFGLFHFCSPI